MSIGMSCLNESPDLCKYTLPPPVQHSSSTSLSPTASFMIAFPDRKTMVCVAKPPVVTYRPSTLPAQLVSPCRGGVPDFGASRGDALGRKAWGVAQTVRLSDS